MIRRIIVGSARSQPAAGPSWSNVRRWRTTWGRFDDAGEAARELPGDDLVPEATAVETRGISIDAPVDAVWPSAAADGLRPGRVVQLRRPGHEGVEQRSRPGRAAAPRGGGDGADRPRRRFRREGRRSRAYPRPVRRPRDPRGAPARRCSRRGSGAGRRRLRSLPRDRHAAEVQRRVGVHPSSRSRAAGPDSSSGSGREWTRRAPDRSSSGRMLGFGVFVMTRRQMLGIKVRAEKLAEGSSAAPSRRRRDCRAGDGSRARRRRARSPRRHRAEPTVASLLHEIGGRTLGPDVVGFTPWKLVP